MLELALNKDLLRARFWPVTLAVRLIQGSSPNFRQLIPQDLPLKVRVQAPDFERAVRRVNEVARDGSGIVRPLCSETKMVVSSKSKEMEAETTIPVTAESGQGRVAINVRCLRTTSGARSAW